MIAIITTRVQCLDNGLARLPPMGFNTWNQFNCFINETIVKKTVDSMVELGLRDLGYKYVVIDDCWQKDQRDPVTKRLVPDPIRFPNGMLALSRYCQSKGMSLGIYSDGGNMTCKRYPGSMGYYELDAQTFAEWEIDFLKFDFCYTTVWEEIHASIYYTRMSKALNMTGRPILFSACIWGHQQPWLWAPKIANTWRTTEDITPFYGRVMENLDNNKVLAEYAGPGAWNDPDMLEVGVSKPDQPGLTVQESRSHFALWSIMAAPLILGNDLTEVSKIPSWVLDIIRNKDVISVNQDPLAVQGVMVAETVIGVNRSSSLCYSVRIPEACTRTEIYVKPLKNQGFAAVLFNRGGLNQDDFHFKPEKMTLDWSKHLKVDPTKVYMVKDLWGQKELGKYQGTFTPDTLIQPHDCFMISLTPL